MFNRLLIVLSIAFLSQSRAIIRDIVFKDGLYQYTRSNGRVETVSLGAIYVCDVEEDGVDQEEVCYKLVDKDESGKRYVRFATREELSKYAEAYGRFKLISGGIL